MPINQMIQKIKDQYPHVFDIDAKGRITLKPDFDIGHGPIPPFTLVPVEGGSFTMGERKGEHNVILSPFFIAKFQVTQELYTAVTGDSPSGFQGINHPVEKVSWIDVVQFCNQLNKVITINPICDKEYNLLDQAGNQTTNITDVKGFRLPTEAEWEYAARAGAQGAKDQFTYAGSNDLDAVAWYRENNEYETKPVGLKFPNQLGVYDMSGNVWEWCWDWYDKDFYEKSKEVNPLNLKKGSYRVLRGGSWHNYSDYCRVAYRLRHRPDSGWDGIGVRIVFAL